VTERGTQARYTELTALQQGGNEALSAAFYSELEPYGVPFDVSGLSYYWILGDGPISDMRAGTAGR
jgi:arabinogalactan endo-1,4-beta-galactosidase